MGDRVKMTSLKELTKGGIQGGGTQASKLSGGSYEDGMNTAAAAGGAPAAGGAGED
jgi:hypothetical protein